MAYWGRIFTIGSQLVKPLCLYIIWLSKIPLAKKANSMHQITASWYVHRLIIGNNWLDPINIALSVRFCSVISCFHILALRRRSMRLLLRAPSSRCAASRPRLAVKQCETDNPITNLIANPISIRFCLRQIALRIGITGRAPQMSPTSSPSRAHIAARACRPLTQRSPTRAPAGRSPHARCTVQSQTIIAPHQ
jgi:hypothetical protein